MVQKYFPILFFLRAFIYMTYDVQLCQCKPQMSTQKMGGNFDSSDRKGNKNETGGKAV